MEALIDIASIRQAEVLVQKAKLLKVPETRPMQNFLDFEKPLLEIRSKIED